MDSAATTACATEIWEISSYLCKLHAEILHEAEWQQQVDRLSAIILASIEQHGWQSGVPLGVETPGFMCGLAGIGYGLLRLAQPKRVPSVLVLEPPRGLQD